MRSLAELLLLAPLAVGLVACPGDREAPSGGSLIVGVQSDDFGSLVAALHVVVKMEGAVVHDETLPTAPGAAAGLSREIAITGGVGARIEVMAEAVRSVGGAPIVSRIASARLAPDGKKLLRVYLESRCAQLGFGATSGQCSAPLTCIAGTCASSDVEDLALEDYEPSWATAPPDICRPAKHGLPEVIIGHGQTSYVDFDEGQILQLERGPQGGHHVWIAARMKNLRQTGSTTAITSRIVDDPQPVPPVSYVFRFERDEGSFCSIWGLRYQVDVLAPDLSTGYKRFLGKRLEVTVEVRDSTGASARDTHTIQLADKLLCPDGTDACTR